MKGKTLKGLDCREPEMLRTGIRPSYGAHPGVVNRKEDWFCLTKWYRTFDSSLKKSRVPLKTSRSRLVNKPKAKFAWGEWAFWVSRITLKIGVFRGALEVYFAVSGHTTVWQAGWYRGRFPLVPGLRMRGFFYPTTLFLLPSIRVPLKTSRSRLAAKPKAEFTWGKWAFWVGRVTQRLGF